MGTLMRTNRDLFPTIPSLFDDMLTRDWFNWSTGNNGNGRSLPAVNIRESNEAFELEVAAPGMNKQDFKVELDNNRLVISAEKQQEHEEQGDDRNYTRREFSYQSFVRSFNLPERMVEGDQISAKYHDGILHVYIPKKEEAKVKPAKQIEIS